jgi:muramidase (phage lysozyme)
MFSDMGDIFEKWFGKEGAKNGAAFADTIKFAETQSYGKKLLKSDNGFNMLFGGEAIPTDYKKHPKIAVPFYGKDKHGKPKLRGHSTAFGPFQILANTFQEIAGKYNLPDISPRSQIEAFCALVKKRGALDAVREGKFEKALQRVKKEWASLPGSGYGQRNKGSPSKQQLKAVYTASQQAIETKAGHKAHTENTHTPRGNRYKSMDMEFAAQEGNRSNQATHKAEKKTAVNNKPQSQMGLPIPTYS